jgi:hypothetical protein
MNEVLSSRGCGIEEGPNHLIVDCTKVQSFWNKIVTWLGVNDPFPIVSKKQATQFCNVFMFGNDACENLHVN